MATCYMATPMQHILYEAGPCSGNLEMERATQTLSGKGTCKLASMVNGRALWYPLTHITLRGWWQATHRVC